MRLATNNGMITISHQYGSGGSLIARELGRRLNWSVWDKEIVHKIATQYQLAEEDVEDKDERVETFLERLVGIMGLTAFETAYSVLPPRWLRDADLVRFTREIVTSIAAEGRAIIIGRGGNHLLAERPRTLHVFIQAPLEVRLQTVVLIEHLARADAERRIAGIDRLRAEYVQSFYHADWRDASRYHLVVDSSVWGDTGTGDVILSAFEHLLHVSAAGNAPEDFSPPLISFPKPTVVH